MNRLEKRMSVCIDNPVLGIIPRVDNRSSLVGRGVERMRESNGHGYTGCTGNNVWREILQQVPCETRAIYLNAQ